MLQIWEGGGPDNDTSEELILERQDTLINLGRRRLDTPDRPLTSIDLPKDALVSLRKDGILRHDTATREVTFAHDMVEDWVLCQVIRHAEISIAQLIQQVGEPLWLVDALQLLAQWFLEREDTTTKWASLLNEVSQDSLEPRWRRAVLAAPMQSTRAAELLARVNDVLWHDNGRLAADLMITMRTVEVEPNPAVLNERLFPDLDDVSRMRLSYEWAKPRLRSWTPFFQWLIVRLDQLPPNLVDGASQVLFLVGEAYDAIPNWAATTVARWSRRWLEFIHPEGPSWRETFDLRQRRFADMGLVDEDACAERLRLIILHCAEGARSEVASFLDSVASRSRHHGAKTIIEHSRHLVRHMPAELVDFLLAVLLSSEDDDGFGYHPSAFNELGIEDYHLFFPASHIRSPFLMLLRCSSQDGIRLINGLCNHAMARWRDILIKERSGTPIPVHLHFPWGEKDFWGHYREYTWNRGIGPGPYIVMSALMALEIWIEEQVAAGIDAEEVFQQVLEGNDCVGVLGACAAVSLANPISCMGAALPLVCSPQLWYWDIHRMVVDGPNNSNTMGLPRDRPYLIDVDKQNRLPHRKQTIRDLVPHLLFTASIDIRQQFRNRMNRLETGHELPFEFEHQRTDQSLISELSDHIRRITALAAPANWQASETGDPGKIYIQFEHPPDIAPAPEFLQHHADLNTASRLALWSEKTLEHNVLQTGVDLDEALAMASALDVPEMFTNPPTDDLLSHHRIGAVSGAAAVFAKFADEKSVALEWSRKILIRAANTPLDENPWITDMSLVSFHPVVNAASGLVGMVERGLASVEDQVALLRLVCHPLVQVKTTLFTALSRCWEQNPLFCWQCFSLGMKISVMPWTKLNERMGDRRLGFTQGELCWIEKLFAEVSNDLEKGKASSLPRVPEPWVYSKKLVYSRSGDYVRSEMAFMWHIAPKVLFPVAPERLMITDAQRRAVLTLVADLMAWTVMDACPPWDRDGGSAFEWMLGFMDWCGQLSASLSPAELERILVVPLENAASKRDGDNLLHYFILGIIRHRLSQDSPASPAAICLWKRLFDIVLSNPSVDRYAQSDGITMGYGETISLMVFVGYGQSWFDHPWPALPDFTPYIAAWVKKFSNSKAYYGQLMKFLTGAGYGLLPEPAITWMADVAEARKREIGFWIGGNGQKTAELLSRFLDDKTDIIQNSPPLRQQMIRITDILVNCGVRLAAHVQQRLAKLRGS